MYANNTHHTINSKNWHFLSQSYDLCVYFGWLLDASSIHNKWTTIPQLWRYLNFYFDNLNAANELRTVKNNLQALDHLLSFRLFHKWTECFFNLDVYKWAVWHGHVLLQPTNIYVKNVWIWQQFHVSKEMYRNLLIFVSNYMCHCQSMQRQYSSGNVSKIAVLNS